MGPGGAPGPNRRQSRVTADKGEVGVDHPLKPVGAVMLAQSSHVCVVGVNSARTERNWHYPYSVRES